MTIARRPVLAGALAALVSLASGAGTRAQDGADLKQSRTTAAAFSFDGLDGGKISLGASLGKPILIVNTASRCGFAGQLGDMSELWTRYHARGLMIVAVPSNDFRQEPGDPGAIRRSGDNYGAKYPFAAIQRVTGPEAHPFYRWAAREKPAETPQWNFHKYLIGADGRLAASFLTPVNPTDPEVIAAIERELGPDPSSRASR